MSNTNQVRKRLQAPAFVAPLAVEWEMDGATLVCGPMDVGQIARIMECAGGLFDSVAVLDDGTRERLMSGEPTPADVTVLLGLLQDQAGTAAEVVAAAMRWDTATAAALLPDRFAYTFAVVVQVNADFFSQALPVFKAAAAVLERVKPAKTPAAPAAGPNSSTA